jgi:hypothetical protein
MVMPRPCVGPSKVQGQVGLRDSFLDEERGSSSLLKALEVARPTWERSSPRPSRVLHPLRTAARATVETPRSPTIHDGVLLCFMKE